MQKINLRELYPDMYKTDTFLEVTDEVQAVFLSDKRAEAAHERQMYRYMRRPPFLACVPKEHLRSDLACCPKANRRV